MRQQEFASKVAAAMNTFEWSGKRSIEYLLKIGRDINYLQSGRYKGLTASKDEIILESSVE